MPRKGNILPKAPLGRILSRVGAKRISEEGLETFSRLLQNYSEKISIQSIKIAEHAGRNTVHDKDIKLANKNIN